MIIVWGSEVLLLLGQIQGAESTREWTPHPLPITLWIDLVKTQIQSHSSSPYAVPCAVLSHFTRVQLFVTLWTYARHAPPSMDSPGKNTEWGTCLAVQWLPGFHCRGHGFDPWLGNQAPTRHALWPKQKNTGVGCHALLQGIFPTQGLNQHLSCLLHWQAVLGNTSTSWEAHRQHDVKPQYVTT